MTRFFNKDKDLRIIKRYGNRKLYDTEISRYVTIEEVAEHIKNGLSVKIIDNQTGDDITSSTLVQIVLDVEKKNRTKSNPSILESVIKTGTLTEFVTRSTNSVKNSIEEVEKWFNQIVDNNKSFWIDIKKHLNKQKDSAKFEEFGHRMENYFKATIDRIKHATSADKKKYEREIISLKQKILELEDKVKKQEEEKRRLMDED